MASNRKKQQKKLDRRKKAVAKAKKKSEKIKNTLAGNENIVFAANAPIYQCLAPEDLFDSGIGQIVISRKLANGNLAVAMFLLDVFCLGIKDAFGRVLSIEKYDQIVDSLKGVQKLRPVNPSYACKLIENGEAYARSIGLQPHSDYAKAKKIFGNIDVNECQEEFIFGKDGKPLYVNGPYDSQTKIQHILNTLTSKLGADGFNFTLIASDMFDDDEDYDEDYDEDDDQDDDDWADQDEQDQVNYGFTSTERTININAQVIDIEATEVTETMENAEITEVSDYANVTIVVPAIDKKEEK